MFFEILTQKGGQADGQNHLISSPEHSERAKSVYKN